LKELTVGIVTMLLGRQFHIFMTWFVKNGYHELNKLKAF